MNRFHQLVRVRHCCHALLAVCALLLCGLCNAQTTLGEVVYQYIPDSPLPIADRVQPITGYAVMDEPNEFIIAYNRWGGSQELQPPLLLLRYLKTQLRWQRGELGESSAAGGANDIDCFGSAMRVAHAGRNIYVTTHINSSAGCTLVLSEDFTLKKVLFGWFLGAFQDGTVIFYNSEVHFAPTHPMEISIYDRRWQTANKIYPPARDAQRTQYMNELDAAGPDEKWCRQFNSHCETQHFSSELGDTFGLNEKTRAFGFMATYSAEGYGPKVEKAVGQRSVIYVFRVLPNGAIAHREFTPEEVQIRFRTSSVDQLLTAGMLKRIFANPSAKP